VTKLSIVIESVTLRRLSGLPERGTVSVPGCLTSDIGRKRNVDGGVLAGSFAAKVDLTEDLQGKAAGRDFGGLTFQVVHCFCAGGMRDSSAELEVCTCAHEKK